MGTVFFFGFLSFLLLLSAAYFSRLRLGWCRTWGYYRRSATLHFDFLVFFHENIDVVVGHLHVCK